MNNTFKNILKALGKSALEEVSGMLPGAGIVIEGITKLFDKNNDNNRVGVEQLKDGIIEAVKSLSPDKVDNAVLVAEGVAELESAFNKIIKGLKS